GGEEPRGPRHRGADLGQDRGQAAEVTPQGAAVRCSAWRRGPSRLLCLETRHRGADRREWAELVLLGGKAVGIGAIGRIDRLLQKGGGDPVEGGFMRARRRARRDGGV